MVCRLRLKKRPTGGLFKHIFPQVCISVCKKQWTNWQMQRTATNISQPDLSDKSKCLWRIHLHFGSCALLTVILLVHSHLIKLENNNNKKRTRAGLFDWNVFSRWFIWYAFLHGKPINARVHVSCFPFPSIPKNSLTQGKTGVQLPSLVELLGCSSNLLHSSFVPTNFCVLWYTSSPFIFRCGLRCAPVSKDWKPYNRLVKIHNVNLGLFNVSSQCFGLNNKD